MELPVNKLKKRIEAAKNEQIKFKDLYQSAYEMAIPQRDTFYTQTKGDDKATKIYDSTGISAVNSFVNRIQSAIFPPFQKWATLTSGAVVDEEEKADRNRLLQNITDIIFAYLHASNFNIAIGEMLYDLSVGTGAMLIQPTNDISAPIKFTSVVIEELAIDEGVEGRVEGIFRTHCIAARGVQETWADAQLTSELKRLITDSPEKEVEFTEATYFSPKNKKWYYDVLYKDDKILSRQLNRNPWLIVRWNKTPNESYGRGPLIQALADIKMLNKGKELAIRSAQLNIFGVYTATDGGVINPSSLKIQPNAIIPVKSNGGPSGPSLMPLPITGNFNAQNFMFEELKMQINKLMLNNQLPPDAGPVRSATEIMERIKQVQTDIGSAFGRIVFEFIQPLLQNVIIILEDLGIIQLPEKLTIDNLLITTQVLSPIALSQNIADVDNMVQVDQILKSIDPSGQTSNMILDTEKLAKVISNKMGIDADVLRSQEEIDQMKTALQEQMAMQNQMNQEIPTNQ